MATKADLRNRILKHLGLLGVDQGEPPAEDAARVEEIIDSVHEDLLERGIVWFETSDIPLSVLQRLAARISLDVRPSFFMPPASPAEVLFAERDLKQSGATGRTVEPVTAVYY